MFAPVGCVLKATARNRIDYDWLRVVRGSRKFSNRKLYRVKSLLCSRCFVYDITETHRKYRIYELQIHHVQYEKKYSELYMWVKLHTRTHIWQMCNFYANISNRPNRLCWLKSRPYTTRTWKYTRKYARYTCSTLRIAAYWPANFISNILRVIKIIGTKRLCKEQLFAIIQKRYSKHVSICVVFP